MPNLSAFEVPGAYQFGFEPGADMSAQLFHAVKMNTVGQVIPIAAITDKPIGVAQSKPALGGSQVTVMFFGITFMVAGAAFANTGVSIGIDATGRAKAIVPGTDTTQYLIGFNVSICGAADELIAVAFNCLNISRAA